MTAAEVPYLDLPHPADVVDLAPAPTRAPGLRDRLLTRAQLADLPEPEPLIGDTLDRRTVALLAGYWGTGKSFLALDWAACIATGKAWQRRPTADVGPVIYVAAEGAHGLHQRLTAWEYAWHTTIDPDRLHILPTPVTLGERGRTRELAAIANDLAAGLIVIDTIARCAVGLDENSARDMGIVVDNLYRLRDATHHGTVLAVHHTGKDKSTVRGSSAIEAGVDTVYQIDADGPALNLDRTKRKDGPTPDRHTLRLEVTTGTNAPVIVSTRGVDIRPTGTALMSTYMSTFAGIGCTKPELRNVANMPPASFSRALSDLVRTGLLINHGTETRPYYREAENP